MITLSNVTFGYQNNQPVLKDFSMQIDEGERLCIMAPSGGGKTTLLRLLCQSLKPQKGEITGLDDKKISMLFQEDRLIEEYTVLENIRLGCLRGMQVFETGDENILGQDTATMRGRDASRKIITEHIAQVGLSGLADEKVCNLSGGMKRRVAIVRAILSESDCVIMDEPFAGIDEEKKKVVASYIGRYLSQRTLIVVTHDQTDCRLLGADRMDLTGRLMRTKESRKNNE